MKLIFVTGILTTEWNTGRNVCISEEGTDLIYIKPLVYLFMKNVVLCLQTKSLVTTVGLEEEIVQKLCK